jgi:hypothetical protein
MIDLLIEANRMVSASQAVTGIFGSAKVFQSPSNP